MTSQEQYSIFYYRVHCAFNQILRMNTIQDHQEIMNNYFNYLTKIYYGFTAQLKYKRNKFLTD